MGAEFGHEVKEIRNDMKLTKPDVEIGLEAERGQFACCLGCSFQE